MRKVVLLLTSIFFFYSVIALAQADLTVQKISISPDKPLPDQKVMISVVITNPAFYDFNGKFTVEISLDNDEIFSQKEEGLKAQNVKTFQSECEPDAGEHKVKVVIDPGDEMEMNAINNIEELTFLVGTEAEHKAFEEATLREGLPDLVCEELIRPSRGDLVPNNTVIFYAIFANYGKESIPGPFAVSWLMDERELAKLAVKDFPPNMKWKFGLKWIAKVGRHNLRAVIDPDNIVNEKTESTNNACDLTFSVHPEATGPEELGQERRVRKLGFEQDLEKIKDDPIYVEEVLLEPIQIEGEKDPNLHLITYVLHNRSQQDYENITITASSEGLFYHTFFVDKLPAGGRYEISFIESVRKGNINFNINLKNDTIIQEGTIVQSNEEK